MMITQVHVRELMAWGLDENNFRPHMDALSAMVEGAGYEVAHREAFVFEDPISRDVPTSITELLAQQLRRADLHAEIAGLDWTVGIVDLRYPLTFQRRLVFDDRFPYDRIHTPSPLQDTSCHHRGKRRGSHPPHLLQENTMSISTTRGDGGQTGLAGGIRVSKADLRVEAYGSVDELNTVLGFARSICGNEQITEWTETIQRTLFRLGSALATPPESKKQPPVIGPEDIAMLTNLVHQIEATEGILSDWSLAGAHRESAAYEVARTVCRRAERASVRFVENGGIVKPEIIAYLNRLSDVIWLFGRLIERNAGIDARLRPEDKAGPKWSRAW